MEIGRNAATTPSPWSMYAFYIEPHKRQNVPRRNEQSFLPCCPKNPRLEKSPSCVYFLAPGLLHTWLQQNGYWVIWPRSGSPVPLLYCERPRLHPPRGALHEDLFFLRAVLQSLFDFGRSDHLQQSSWHLSFQTSPADLGGNSLSA